MLTQEMERYVSLKRAVGLKFDMQNKLLKRFVAFATARGDEFIRVDRILEWAALTPSLPWRRVLVLTVRCFAISLRVQDSRHEVPARESVRKVRVTRPAPYIYTPDEITRLMQQASLMPAKSWIAPTTCRTLLGLLAATGLRISEALALTCGDVSTDGLIIRKAKYGKSRLIPLHHTTRAAVEAYLRERSQQANFDDHIFVSSSGHALKYAAALKMFHRLLATTGLRSLTNRRDPRLHDLRHTFAVRSLEQCGHDRDAVARHIVALSTYLGHTCVSDTYWYLEATPLVLAQIAQAGESMYQRGAL